MRRSIMIALIALLALAMAAPTVLAQGNGGAPEDASATYSPDDLAGFPGVCTNFPMQLEFTGKTKLIELPDGGVVFSSISASPDLNVTITNLESGEQATFNVTGAVLTKKPDSDGNVETVLTGRNFAIDPEVGTVITIGRFTFVFDKDGNLIQPQAGEGQRIDICELLATEPAS